MKIREAYRVVTRRMLGLELEHIHIEVVHKFEGTTIVSKGPLEALALGIGMRAPELIELVIEKTMNKAIFQGQYVSKKVVG